MFSLHNKTILLISPQSWGKMFLSKQHYAIELAKRGNKVYFLNPPNGNIGHQTEAIEIISSDISSNLFLINHQTWFSDKIKFHAMPLFHALMKFHVNKVKKKIPEVVDIVWSFDLGNHYPFHFFGKELNKIFHPVDEPLNKTAIDSAKGCDIIFSVTNEILEKYQKFSAPKYFINHGVSEEFLRTVDVNRSSGDPLHIGFSGNLLRNDIDRVTLQEIISENENIIFDFFGSYKKSQTNIGGEENSGSEKFISFLQSKKNVMLHGTLSQQMLADKLHQMDAFIICYDIKKDQSKGTNYHKIMEYLSTGKVIVSNNVTTYKNKPDLLIMSDERENNLQLPTLFKKVMNDLHHYNNADLQQKRIAFAKDNTYPKQIERIEQKLQEHFIN
ncbi:MAG TPA: hypothetical protein VHZ50_07330 [Puia sp.]|jgi:hypothetical protein|nr:hypothetical protein [Puia sp.]